MRKARSRTLKCDHCGGSTPMTAPELAHRHANFDVPEGWSVRTIPGYGIVIHCSERCARQVGTAASLKPTVSPTA